MVKADWKIYEEDYWAITSVLKELLKNSNSQSVLLIDKTGQMIASVGVEPDFDLMSFASLCAADFEAKNERLLGRYCRCVDEAATTNSSDCLALRFLRRRAWTHVTYSGGFSKAGAGAPGSLGRNLTFRVT